MRTWHCPSCDLEVEAIATEVTHRCPRAASRWTRFHPERGKPRRPPARPAARAGRHRRAEQVA